MSRTGPNRLLRLSPLVLLVSFGLYWFADTVADPDLWGHVRFGQDILRTRSAIQTDSYSYRTQGQSWINHEWLSEVIIARIYDWSGAQGLIVSKVLVSLLILGVCHAHLRRRGLGPWSSVLLLIMVSIPFRMGLGTIRPQIFTICFFLLELLLLESAAAGREQKLWVLPLLMAAWVNLHGGVLAGIATLGLWIGARIARYIWSDSRPLSRRLAGVFHLVLLGIACGLALLFNPYSAELPRFLLRTATVARPEIKEWAPLGLLSLPGQLYLGLLAITILGLAGSARRPRLEAILILSMAAVQPLISNRHYPLFALAVIVLGGEHIADAWSRWRARSASPETPGGLAFIGLALSLFLIGLSLPRFNCIRIEPYYFPFPARLVALMKQSEVAGNMAVPFDWGEYVLWHLGPRIKVSNDGRRETLYSDLSYQQSRDFEHGTGIWNALLKNGPATDFVLAPLGSPTVNLLSLSQGWVALYKDTLCVVFVRSEFPGLDRITRLPVPDLPDNGRGLCFPGPAPWHKEESGSLQAGAVRARSKRSGRRANHTGPLRMAW